MLNNNSVPLAIDLLAGDEKVAQREDFLNMTGEDLDYLSQLFIDNPDLSQAERQGLLDNLWRMNYIVRPPTPEEFLSPQYLGEVADMLYPQVRQNFIDFLNPEAGKRVLVLSTCIGYGKSTLAVLIIIYLIVQFSFMRDAKHYLKVNVAGSLVAALLSFSLKKSSQLLMQPFINVLRASPIFERTTQEERLITKQQEIGNHKIAYTTAGRMGSLQFAKDIHVAVMSDRSALLGLNIFAGIASEISFWANRGVSLDDIWGTFSDLRGRINNRFYGRYLTATILDSSPIDITLSPIDKWIYGGDASRDPEVMIVNAKHWEIYDWKYPKWKETGETFPIFRGDATRPPKFLDTVEISKFTPDDVYHVPVDLYQQFVGDLKKSIADYCAYPSGSDSKLISNLADIEKMFYTHLRNLYRFIHAPSNVPPDQLIWNQIVDTFFLNIAGNYEFWRYPHVPRYLHLDCSESKDTSSIAMVHMEMDNKGDRVVVIDFTIPIMATKDRINLDAISTFITDLVEIGRVKIAKISADRYQSSAMIQRFKRYGLDADHLSVDRTTTPYKVVVSWLLTGKLKGGQNILLKNNLKSLMEVTADSGHTKIDHVKTNSVIKDGDWGWNSSQIGFGAKDVSDSVAGAAFACIENEPVAVSNAIWEEKEMHLDEKTFLSSLEDKYSLTIRR